MTANEPLRRTPLHAAHVRGGGRMVGFAGWSLPVQFSGVIEEHTAVRTRAGIFDVSHMGEAAVRGPGALRFLQHVTCNDVGRLVPGKAQYTALTTPEGTIVDDLLLYQTEEDEYLLVLNAANTSKDVAWLLSHAAGFDAEVQDVSERWAQIAVQGPLALAVLERLSAAPLSSLKPFRSLTAEVAAVPCLVSRTGYTGEDGFEIYTSPAGAPAVWSELLRAGEEHGLLPVGLGARDTLRLEARLALYGNDIDETTTVVEADLGWIVRLDKGEFLGRARLAREIAEGTARRLVGFEMRGRGIARSGHAAFHDGERVGHVTSGTHSPTLKKSIGLAYLPTAVSAPGTEFEIDLRGRRERAVVVTTPFYTRPRAS